MIIVGLFIEGYGYLFLPLVWPHGPIGHLGGPAPESLVNGQFWGRGPLGPPKRPIGPCGQTRGRNKYVVSSLLSTCISQGLLLFRWLGSFEWVVGRILKIC
jgi:hypothetical protein